MSFHISLPFWQRLHQNKKLHQKKMKLLKIFTLASMVATGSVASSASSDAAEPRQRRFLVSQNDL